MSWRRINYILHRDIGYLCVGLTLIYAVSGIAVNHISPRFNPSYTIDKSSARVSPLPTASTADMNYIKRVLGEVGEEGKFKNGAFVSPGVMRIFVEGNTLDVDLATGMVAMEKVKKKPVLYQANYLHLNKAKGIWTWLADIYGVALFVLALTGMLMIKGKRKKRAILLTAIGFLIPLVYLLTSS